MNKNIWIIANWKSNKTIKEALEWLFEIGPKLPEKDPPDGGLKFVVCPMFSVIPEFKKAVDEGGFPILIGSQDISPFGIGAYTGEEPAEFLKQYINLSIIGHSERRENFKETDEIVSQKTQRALEQGIIPLVCVQNEETPVPNGCNLIAYEPVFAIGTGEPDTPENASKVAGSLKNKYGSNVEILYGGSVNSENIKSFLSLPNINGVLIGKSSLDADKFLKIIEEILE